MKDGFLSVTTSTVATLLLEMAQPSPLVYPNKFSFQKTTTTSSTPLPKFDHNFLNNSIPALGNETESEGFRYDIAAWVTGTLIFLLVLVAYLYPKCRGHEQVPTPKYTFQPTHELKGDQIDCARMIIPEGQS